MTDTSQTQKTSADMQKIITLNDVAVEYFRLGLQDLSYHIWEEQYHDIQGHFENFEELLPVVSCNMGNALRHAGCYEEAYRICRQGLKSCFGTGVIYAMPELTIQEAILFKMLGAAEEAKSLFSFGKNIFCWTRHVKIRQTMEEMMQWDFLLQFEPQCPFHHSRTRMAFGAQ